MVGFGLNATDSTGSIHGSVLRLVLPPEDGLDLEFDLGLLHNFFVAPLRGNVYTECRYLNGNRDGQGGDWDGDAGGMPVSLRA